MIGTNQINLVIVYTADTRKHADYLRDLIALQDDLDGNVSHLYEPFYLCD